MVGTGLFGATFAYLAATDSILIFWLKNPPEYTAIFVKLMIIVVMVDSLSGTLQQAALASGKIRKYTTTVTGIFLTNIIWVYIAFKMGFPPQSMLYIEIALYFIVFWVRLIISRKLIELNVSEFLREVTVREFLTAITTAIIVFPICLILRNTVGGVIAKIVLAFGVALTSSLFIGFKRTERNWIISLIREKVRHKNKNISAI